MSISNSIDITLLSEFYQYLKSNGTSDSHQNNNLKALTSIAHFLESVTFFDIKRSEMKLVFLIQRLRTLGRS